MPGTCAPYDPNKDPKAFQQFCEGAFVLHKSPQAFSSIALDHAHEQANALVKGDGGAVSLTESPGTLLVCMVAGPELTKITRVQRIHFCYHKERYTPPRASTRSTGFV